MTRHSPDNSVLWRSWLAFTAIIAIVLVVLTALSILQHNAMLARLVESRLAVVAQSTASSFRPIVNLGLPISAVRNAGEILKRGRELDPQITAIRAFNPSGIIVQSLPQAEGDSVSREILQAQVLADEPHWSLETPNALISGYSIINASGTIVGGIQVEYPVDRYREKSDSVAMRIIKVALVLLAALSLLSWLILRWKLRGAIQGVSAVALIADRLNAGEPFPESQLEGDTTSDPRRGVLRRAIIELESSLQAADRSYRDALEGLGASADEGGQASGATDSSALLHPVAAPESSIARHFSRRLTPWITGVVLLAVLALGQFAYREVGRSLQPELVERTSLIATVANRNIQRAVSSGVPLESLVGAESFFRELLDNFPEISYFGVSTGRIIFESGNRQSSPFAPARARKDVPTFAIHDGERQIGYIIVDTNPAYFALQFRNVLLDLGVVLVVAVLLAFEIMVVMLSLSLTGPFNRLHYLAEMQASGDFSAYLVVRARNVGDRLSQILSARALRLHALYDRAMSRGEARLPAVNPVLDRLASPPRRLQFSYLNDVRLPLFLFAAADELPISFLPIFTRAADNPLAGLDPGLVLSLPLAGYLVAIVLLSPFARPMSERFGHRALFICAVVPAIFAHLGLSVSTTTVEIILYRTLVGASYAIATLTCQDYILTVVRRESRSRALGLFTGTMFGGIFAGTAIGGILADRFGFQVVFVISAVLVLIAGLLILRMLPGRSRQESTPPVLASPGFPPILAPLGNRRFRLLVFGIAIPASVLLQAFISFLVALQLDAIGASAADIGRVLMTYFLAIALISPVAPRLYDQRLRHETIVLAGALISACALAAALWPTYWAMLLAVAGSGVGHALMRDPQVAIAMDIAEEDLAAFGPNAVLGSLRTLERAGSILGLLALALLSSQIGYRATIGVVGIWVLVGAVVFMPGMQAGRRLPKRDSGG